MRLLRRLSGNGRKIGIRLPDLKVHPGKVRPGKLGLKETLEQIQIDRIELTEPLHPDRSRAHRIGIKFAPCHPPPLFLLDQPGLRQDLKMFGNRRQRHVKRLGHIGDGHVILQKHGQDRPPRRVGKRGKDKVQPVIHPPIMPGRRITVNQGVEYENRPKPAP